MLWRLNRIQYPIYNLGNGKRIGIWVQGCSLGCKGCISQTLHTKKGGKDIDIEDLADEIAKNEHYFNGLTITGGEPFQQYAQLIAFCAWLKQKTKLEIYVFSGYSLDELLKKFPDQLFLKYIDYLMDGRYIQEKHDNQNVRGSSNQTLYKFECGKAIRQKSYFSSDKFGLMVNEKSNVYMSGIPKENELNDLANHLKKTGIDLIFK